MIAATIILSALLAAATPQATAPTSSAFDVTLPDAQTSPAPNIHLEHFEYAFSGDPQANAVDYDEMIRLEVAIKKAAASTLARSRSQFGIRASYALSADKPAAFRMQVAGDAQADAPLIKAFYDKASVLKAFHCKSGKVFVTFDYRISPAIAGHH